MRKQLLALLGAWIASAALAAPVEVNTASEAALDGVQGLGPASTRLVLAERAKAPFKDWADLRARVKGIGAARAARLSAAGLTVAGESLPLPSASGR